MLCPAPVGRLRTREASALWKAAERVSVIVLLLEPILVPHWVRDDSIKGLQAVARAELRIFERVANFDCPFHVVDDHVHVRHGPRGRDIFLATYLQWRVFCLAA